MKIENSSKPKASIIILDYMKAKRVCQNVKSILVQKVDFPIEIVVADNSSNPENADQLKKLDKYENVQVHINNSNLGYVEGNNGAAKHATGEYILIVNPDIIWREDDTLQKMIDYMDQHEEIGILGPKQINDGNGEVAMTVRAFPKLFLQIARRTWLRKLPLIRGWVEHDEMQHLNYNKIQEVDWLQSSFWVMRKDLWDNVGGLSDDYFLFMSDPDMCHKVWKKGFKVVYYPEATVYADGIRLSQGGMKAFFQKWTLRQHMKDAIKYRWKHLFGGNPRQS